MKEAFGGISIFQIVIVFLLLFAGIMCLTINHSKAYAVKDEIINIIEKNELTGISDNGQLSNNVLGLISEHMKDAGYRITGRCPSDTDSDDEVSRWVGYDRNGSITTGAAAFCVRANNLSEGYQGALAGLCHGEGCTVSPQGSEEMYYYDIVLFYQLDIPGLNQIMNFKLYGSTKVLYE